MARSSGRNSPNPQIVQRKQVAERRISLILPICEEADSGNQFQDLDQQTFFQLAQESKDEIWSRLLHHFEREGITGCQSKNINILEEQIADLNIRLRRSESQNSRLQQALQRAEQERDAFALRIARGGSDVADNFARTQTAEGLYTIPDPACLTDGEDPAFHDWLLAMQQTIRARQYDTPEKRIAYVFSRTEGLALKYLVLRFFNGPTNLFKDSEDMFRRLGTIFDDPEKRRRAKDVYVGYSKKRVQCYSDFVTKLMRLALDTGISQAEYKEDLLDALTILMQDLSPTAFKDFDQTCSKVATRLEKTRNTSGNPFVAPRGGTPAGPTANSCATGEPASKTEDCCANTPEADIERVARLFETDRDQSP